MHYVLIENLACFEMPKNRKKWNWFSVPVNGELCHFFHEWKVRMCYVFKQSVFSFPSQVVSFFEVNSSTRELPDRGFHSIFFFDHTGYHFPPNHILLRSIPFSPPCRDMKRWRKIVIVENSYNYDPAHHVPESQICRIKNTLSYYRTYASPQQWVPFITSELDSRENQYLNIPMSVVSAPALVRGEQQICLNWL